jgi:glycosyltransferase involved in cell wall biosynthesis
VVGSVGRLEPQKRFDLLIRAFGRLLQRRPGARLVIAGDGPERPTLENLIADLALRDSCRLVGHVDDVIGFHHSLDVFVQSSEYEGTPNVILEAMALETPVVATDVGGTSELCHPGIHGLIVAPGDVEVLTRAIGLTFSHVEARDVRVRAARRRVEQELSFERRLRRLEDIYDGVARDTAT